jgi:hypothetical protein
MGLQAQLLSTPSPVSFSMSSLRQTVGCAAFRAYFTHFEGWLSANFRAFPACVGSANW